MRGRLPCRSIVVVRLITHVVQPLRVPRAKSSKNGPGAARLDDRPPDNGWPLDSVRARPYVRTMSTLRETRGVVVVRCLHCGHEGSLSRTALVRFGLDPNAPIAAYVKRLRW
jgi:hypothetical protein